MPCAWCAGWIKERSEHLDILFLLIPLSVVLVLFIIAGLWWAIYAGQIEDTEAEGQRIFKHD